MNLNENSFTEEMKIKKDLFCLSVHNPSIPSRYVTLFQQKQNNIGFLTGSDRGLVDMKSEIEKEFGINNSEYEEKIAQEKKETQNKLPKVKKNLGSVPSETYFRYIFVGKSANIKAKIAKNGIIEYDGINEIFKPKFKKSKTNKFIKNTTNPLNSKILEDLKLNTQSFNINSDDNNLLIKYFQEESEKVNNLLKPDSETNKFLKQSNLSDRSSKLETSKLKDYINTKKILIKEYLNNLEQKKAISKFSEEEYNVFDNKDYSILIKNLKKQTKIDDKAFVNCSRESILFESFKNKKVTKLAKTSSEPKEVYKFPVPGPGHYDSKSYLFQKENSLSKKGFSGFASTSKKILDAIDRQTDALYFPQIQKSHISHQINDGSTWV